MSVASAMRRCDESRDTEPRLERESGTTNAARRAPLAQSARTARSAAAAQHACRAATCVAHASHCTRGISHAAKGCRAATPLHEPLANRDSRNQLKPPSAASAIVSRRAETAGLGRSAKRCDRARCPQGRRQSSTRSPHQLQRSPGLNAACTQRRTAGRATHARRATRSSRSLVAESKVMTTTTRKSHKSASPARGRAVVEVTGLCW